MLADVKGVLARDVAKVISKKYKVEALGIKTDVTKKEDIMKLLEIVLDKFDRIDILINNVANDPKVKTRDKNVEWSRFEHFSLN